MPDPALSSIPPGVDPSDWIQAQRLLSASDALTQQSFTPEMPRQTGAMAARASPLAVPLKLLEAYMGRKAFEQGAAKSAQNYAAALDAFSPGSAAPVSVPSSVPDVPAPPTTGVQSPGMLRAPPALLGARSQASRWNPQGLPPQFAMRLFQSDPKAYMAYLLGPEAVQTGRLAGIPTQEAAARSFSHATDPETVQLANAGGVDPAAAARAALVKSSAIDSRAGANTLIPDGHGGYTTIRNPVLGQGALPITDSTGNVVGVETAPGQLQYEAGQHYAEEAGKEGAQLRELTDSNGRKYYLRGVDATPSLLNNPFAQRSTPIAMGGQNAPAGAVSPPPEAGNTATGQNAAPGGAVSGRSGPNTAPSAQNRPSSAPEGAPAGRNYFGAAYGSQQSTSQHEAQEKLASRGVEYQNELVDANNGALQMKQNLQELRNLAANVNPSANAEMRLKAAVWARAMGIDADDVTKFFGLDPGDAEAMEKLRATLATSGIKQITSRGTNLDLSTFMKANPNIGMTPQGFQKALDYMDRQADVAIDRFEDFHKFAAGHDASDWERGHTAQWNRTFLSNLKAGKYTLGPNSPTTDAGSALRPGAAPTLAEVRAERARRARAAQAQSQPQPSP